MKSPLFSSVVQRRFFWWQPIWVSKIFLTLFVTPLLIIKNWNPISTAFYTLGLFGLFCHFLAIILYFYLQLVDQFWSLNPKKQQKLVFLPWDFESYLRIFSKALWSQEKIHTIICTSSARTELEILTKENKRQLLSLTTVELLSLLLFELRRSLALVAKTTFLVTGTCM